MTITNAKDQSVNSPNLMNMQTAMFGLFQNVKFLQVIKTIQNHEVFEKVVVNNFQGVSQPFTPRQLQMKPEGERAWKWWTIHATIGLVLEIDDIIWIGNVKFRVESIWGWNDYGFVEYHCCQDYTDRSTAPPAPNADSFERYAENIVATGAGDIEVDVSDDITDAQTAIWRLQDSDGNELVGSWAATNATTVTITVPAAGTYRLIGDA